MDSPNDIEITAPEVPLEFRFNQSVTHFQKTPNGGMELVFTPAVMGPKGPMLVMPQVRISFGSKEEWERFQSQVEKDGKMSDIQIIKPSMGSI
jgi:hypothetical protein